MSDYIYKPITGSPPIASVKFIELKRKYNANPCRETMAPLAAEYDRLNKQAKNLAATLGI